MDNVKSSEADLARPELRKIGLQQGLVYGPVNSRRLGRSLGVNPFPDNRKICSFNCAYCQYSWTPPEGRPGHEDFPWPSADEVSRAMEAALAAFSREGIAIDALTLAGNGEPTLHPEFGRIVDEMRLARDRFYPRAEVAILSNGTEAHRPEVARHLRKLDICCLKLDGGTPEQIRMLNIPVPEFSFGRALDAFRALDNVTIQSLFVRGRVDNTTDEAVDAYLDHLGRVRPRRVQVYSVDRAPADLRLEKVPADVLERIAARIREAVSVPVEVF